MKDNDERCKRRLQRLGRSLGAKLLQRVCGQTEKRLHINVLELKVVSLALERFKDQCQNQTVLVAMDKSRVVAYINKQGGTHSAEISALVEDHDLVPSLPDNLKSQTHSRVSECDGLPVQVEPSLINRMVTASAGVQTDLSLLM